MRRKLMMYVTVDFPIRCSRQSRRLQRLSVFVSVVGPLDCLPSPSLAALALALLLRSACHVLT